MIRTKGSNSSFIQMKHGKHGFPKLFLLFAIVIMFSLSVVPFTGDNSGNSSDASATIEPVSHRPAVPGEIEITTETQLRNVGKGGLPPYDVYTLSAKYILMADIVLSSSPFDPIGPNGPNAFTGSFDGNGYTITGMTINIVATTYVGMFGWASSTSELTNIALEGGSITADNTSGIILGGVAGWSEGRIINCYNTGSIDLAYTGNGLVYAGGIAGNLNGTIDKCYFAGDITVKSGSTIFVGGIASRLITGSITNCYNTGSINGETTGSGWAYAGGILSSVNDVGAKSIAGCYNTGAIVLETDSTNAYAGGIIAIADTTGDAIIENCYNTASVKVDAGAEPYAGGIGGYINIVTIVNSHNTGDIESAGVSNIARAGGITSCSTANSKIESCYNTGNITAYTDGANRPAVAGGITGSSGGSIIGCYNLGDISVETTGGGNVNAGGIAGVAGANSPISWCYNRGAVEAVLINGTIFAGGIAGYLDATINDCYNVGPITTQITGTGTENVGGIAGHSAGIVNYSYYLASVPSDIGNKGSARTLEQLRLQTDGTIDVTTYAGWTFTPASGAIWTFDGADALNLGFPTLVDVGSFKAYFTEQPAFQYMRLNNVSDDAVFAVTATSHHTMSYEWQYLNASDVWVIIPGSNNSSLVMDKTTYETYSSGTQFRCIVYGEVFHQGSASTYAVMGISEYSILYYPVTNPTPIGVTHFVNNVDDLLRVGTGIVDTLGDGTAWNLEDTYIQTTNITLPPGNFTPIGDLIPFSGIYDGSGYFIENMVVNRSESAGMFRSIVGATIANLGFVDSHFTSTTAIAGSIASYSGGYTSITNCYNVGGSVTAFMTAGGIIGVTGGVSTLLITGCYNTSVVLSGSPVSTSGEGAGGIIGLTDSTTILTATNCYNAGDVSSVSTYHNSGAGGIVGIHFGNNYITDCHNDGVISSATYAGGIIGGLNTGEALIKRSYNTGDITGVVSAGGITGGSLSILKMGVADCYNTGDVQATTSGGIVGFDGGGSAINTPITGCFNTGTVRGSGGISGGILGASWPMSNAVITNCYNEGYVNNATAGGIMGATGIASTVKVIDSYNVGDVEGSVASGGISGFAEMFSTTTITNCYVAGIIIGTTKGGIVGDISTTMPAMITITVTGSYYLSSVAIGTYGTYKTSGELKLQSTFDTWDFWTTWRVSSIDNDGYPILRIFDQEISLHPFGETDSIEPEVFLVAVNIPDTVSSIQWYGFDESGTFGVWKTLVGVTGNRLFQSQLDLDCRYYKATIVYKNGIVEDSVFARAEFSITYDNNGGSGTIDRQLGYGTVTLSDGTGFTRSNYYLEKWNTLADGTGTDYALGGSYDLLSGVTLYAIWAQFTITYDNNTGSGTIAPQLGYGTVTLSDGTGFSKTNYYLEKWNTLANGTGTDYALGGSYNLTADITLYAIWAQLTITYDNNTGSGTIAPQLGYGTVTLSDGTGFSKTNYYLEKWNTFADGTGTDYTLGGPYSLTTNVTLYAVWSQYIIAVTHGPNGTASSDTAAVAPGGTATITATPAMGYIVDTITDNSVDVTSLLSGDQYIISGIFEDHAVHVTFKRVAVANYIITSVSDVNSTISPEGRTQAGYGSDVAYVFAPKEGYKISRIVIDGEEHPELVSSGSYTFRHVNMNHHIQVYSEHSEGLVSMTVEIDGEGLVEYTIGSVTTVTYGGTFWFERGTDVALKAFASENNHFVVWKTGSSRYTNVEVEFNNIRASMIVTAEFDDNSEDDLGWLWWLLLVIAAIVIVSLIIWFIFFYRRSYEVIKVESEGLTIEGKDKARRNRPYGFTVDGNVGRVEYIIGEDGIPKTLIPDVNRGYEIPKGEIKDKVTIRAR